ncbi:MAG: argininosuccinate synthase [Gammaproteobacteria bacterium]
MANKIVLAYSGGLDTSVAIKWLQDQGYEVIALAADVGEGKDLAAIKDKAIALGAKCYVIDAKQRLAEDYVFPALQANALYEGQYPLISALSRPLIAQLLVETAHKEGAVAVSHGCTGKGNDQVRFDVSLMSLDPELKIIAPVRENPMSREAAITYAQKHDIPVPVTKENPFSIDQNLWGRSCECGVLEDPWVEPPEAAYGMTASIAEAPEQAQEIIIDFEQGLPVAIDGQKKILSELILDLNKIAGQHGVGRLDLIENRLVGIKSREIYEAPAAITLIAAHRALESLTLTRELAHFKPLLEQRFAHLIYEGMWHSPLRVAIAAFLKSSQKTVTGSVRLKLHKGQAIVVGRRSERSLYQFKLATYDPSDQFDHSAAEGFIKLWGLPLQVNYQVNAKLNKEDSS